MKILKCTVNGKPVQVGYDPRESLLDTLRNRLGLTSVKRGCEVGECGACTVLIDGVATDTCLYLTDWAQGKQILTVEGLQAPDGTLNPVQQAFVDEFAVQCGFCIPGIIMSAMEMVDSGKTFHEGRDPQEPLWPPLPLHRLPEHHQRCREGHRNRPREGRRVGHSRPPREGSLASWQSYAS